MILVLIPPRHYNFARLSIKTPLLNVVAVHAPERVKVTDTSPLTPLVLNLSAETPPDIIVAVLLMIIGAATLNVGWLLAADAVI
jgi:hypothetical protein